MHPLSLVSTYKFLECCKADTLLLPSLHRVIHQHARVENMNFPVAEDLESRYECAPRALERVRQEASEDDTAEASETSHEDEQPEPTRTAGYTTHV